MECRSEVNAGECNCTYPCDKKGFCCECIRYPRIRNELPACYFPANLERTYDRSIGRFTQLHRR
jgi:hypothetical protein